MRTPEQEAVLRSVRKLVDFWQIDAHELSAEASTVQSCIAPMTTAPAAPKYRHPRTGEVWDGEGSQPDWLRLALTKQGYTVDELRVSTPEHAALLPDEADQYDEP